MKRVVSVAVLFLAVVILVTTQGRTGTAPLKVVYSSPQKVVNNVENGIVVTFDRPMVPLAPAVGRPEGPLLLEPAIPGVYRWLGVRTLVFYPKNLPLATRFKATVPAGTRSADGATLPTNYTFTFQTVRPLLERWSPDSYTPLHKNVRMILGFNLPMDPTRVASALKLVDAKGAPGPALTVRSLAKGDLARGEESRYWPGDKTVVVEPQTPLVEGASYQLILGAGVRAREGNLGSEKAHTIPIQVAGPLHFKSLEKASEQDPGDPLQFAFNNSVSPVELAKHVHLSPAAPLKLNGSRDYHSERPRLLYGLAPNTRYRLTIDADLKDTYGYRLGREKRVELRTTERGPMVVAPVGPHTLESYLSPLLPVGLLNTRSVRMRAAKLTRATVVPVLEKYQGRDWSPTKPTLDQLWAPASRANLLAYHPFDLSKLLEGGQGLLALRMDPVNSAPILDVGSRYPSYRQASFLQVTRLGITGKFSPQDILLWITDLESCAGQAGVDVELRDSNNHLLWKGKSDAQGLVKAPGRDDLKITGEDRRIYAIASQGKDLAVLSSAWQVEAPVERSYGAFRPVETLIVSDRGLYRGGDKVFLKGIMREHQGRTWAVPPSATPLHLTIHNSRGEEFTALNLTSSTTGSFDFSVELPKEAPTGNWQVTLGDEGEAGQQAGNFRVEAYRPAQFEVTVQSPRSDYFVGESLTPRIQARYLYGAPMGDAPVQWSAIVAPFEFTSPLWKGMNFGADPWLNWRSPKARNEALQASAEGKLDAQGGLAPDLVLRPGHIEGPAQVTVEASVKAVDSSQVTGRTVVNLHPAEVYVGLRPTTTFLAANSEVSARAVLISPDGKAQPGKSFRVDLVRREYRSVRRDADSDSEWVSVPKDVVVAGVDLTSSDKELPFSLKAQGPGLYLLRGRATDSSGRKTETTASLYVYGGEGAGWERGDDHRLELTPDRRDSYKQGETARVAISSPFPKARVLVTVEREGILERFVADVKGSAPVIEVPIRDEYLPNVFVSVALISGRTERNKFGAHGEDLARPAFRLGYLKIPVDPGSHRLNVDIKPDREKYAPGDNVTVDLQVRDASGAGKAAEVTFVAADEGVLNLIDYHLADPLSFYFHERGLRVETSETRQQIVGQRRFGEKGGPGGDGDGPAARAAAPTGSFRWNFEATPCWKPSIQTDAQGRARVVFKLPDSVTAFRMSALAHTSDAHFGRGENRIRVSQPLAMTPSWPRFCTIGDDATAGVLVHNQTGAAGNVTVSLQAEGVDVVGPAQLSVTLDSGQARQLRFSLRASKYGKARLRFVATVGSHSDSLQAEVPVNVPRLSEAAAARDSVETSFDTSLQVPTNALPGTARLDLAMSSSALAGLQPAVEYLKAYPYECLEQKVSRVMPIVAAREIIEAFGGDVKAGRGLVQEVLDSLPNLQTPSGGLALWPDHPVNPWATAYALQFCARAQQQGYKIPTSTCETALDYLKTALTSESREIWPYYSERERVASKAYMLATLAMWDRHDEATMSALYQRRAQLPLSGLAWLLRAESGHKAESAAVARMLLDKLVVDARTAHFEERATDLYRIYESPTRSTALALEALLESKQDFPQAAQVVSWLVDRRENGRWRTTQENATVFHALASWYRQRESAPPDFTATIKLAGQESLKQAFKGRDLSIVSRRLDLPLGQTPLQILKEGKGTLYLSALLRYATLAPESAADAGLSVIKEVEVVQGKSEGGAYAPGTLLRVKLTICTGEERAFVVVNDPLAGGMELVQSGFATERTDVPEEEADTEKRWWGTFNRFENYDDRVLLFADTLHPGVHHYSYLVRTAFPGRYTMPATYAEAMYEPEVFGRSLPSEINIR